MERLEELLEELVADAHEEGVCNAKELPEQERIAADVVELVRQEIIDHVASLVEAAKKEGGENG